MPPRSPQPISLKTTAARRNRLQDCRSDRYPSRLNSDDRPQFRATHPTIRLVLWRLRESLARFVVFLRLYIAAEIFFPTFVLSPAAGSGLNVFGGLRTAPRYHPGRSSYAEKTLRTEDEGILQN